MIKRLPSFAALALIAALFGAVSLSHAQSQPESYRELLAEYVSAGPDGVNLVDYAKWNASAADMKRLDDYLAHLQKLKPSQMDRAEAFAFWTNLYNAATLKVVLDRYPVESIRDIKSEGTSLFDFKALYGPWRTKLVTVEGRSMSLDDIEHETLRKHYDDPRVHYAVNCASIGCPNLKPTPWTAETLEVDLDAAARAYINHPRGVTVRADGRLDVSSIYIWFQEDFGGSERGVIQHLRKYAEAGLKKKLTGNTLIVGDGYDWSLNDVRKARASQ
ncbi:MAG: DUF547 domain-containing protein [Rhodomicrobiaceae bacterium]